MEQLVARWAHNPKAVGSSPAPATRKALAFMPGLFFMPYKKLNLLELIICHSENQSNTFIANQPIDFEY